jgi:hypothetical protein
MSPLGCGRREERRVAANMQAQQVVLQPERSGLCIEGCPSCDLWRSNEDEPKTKLLVLDEIDILKEPIYLVKNQSNHVRPRKQGLFIQEY